MKIPEIAGCGVFDSRISFGGNTKSSLRKVQFFEIEYYDEEGKSSYIDGRMYPIQKGNVLVAKPGQSRYSLLHMRNSYLWLVPDDGEVSELLMSLPDVFPVAKGLEIEGILADLRKARSSSFSGSNFYAASKLLELVYLLKEEQERLGRRQGEMSDKNFSTDGIIKASKLIDENFSRKITLEDCAKQANLSPVYFHKLFTVVMGKTPHEYLMDKRMSAAMDMLVSTKYPLSRIADECGFSSQSYFTNVFREKIGLTPGDYRKEKLKLERH